MLTTEQLQVMYDLLADSYAPMFLAFGSSIQLFVPVIVILATLGLIQFVVKAMTGIFIRKF